MLPAVMAPPTELPEKKPTMPKSTPPLNERILSSLSRKTVAAHPWHDLEIGMCLYFYHIYIILHDTKACNVLSYLSMQDLELLRSLIV